MRKISSMKRKIAATGLAMALVISGAAAPGQQASAAAVKKVSVSKKSVTLYKGATADYSQVKLTASVNPKKAAKVTWTSSKKSVATVSASGLVKAKKAGKAVITAKAGNKRAACNVTVKSVKKITKLTVKSKSVTITKGKTQAIKTTVAPANATLKKLTYTSANKKVATVSASGVIKGIKAGKTTITVKAVDGSKKSATVSVTVKNAASANPSTNPSANPSVNPSANPSTNPSTDPSTDPSANPSADPSASPSTDPSASPSTSPSTNPGGNIGPSLPTLNPGASAPAANTVTGGVIEVSNTDGTAVEGSKDTTNYTIKYILKSNKAYKINVAGTDCKVDSVVFTVLNKLDLSKWASLPAAATTYTEGAVTVVVTKTSDTAATLVVSGYSESDVNGNYSLTVAVAGSKYTLTLAKQGEANAKVVATAEQSADKAKVTITNMTVTDKAGTQNVIVSGTDTIVLDKKADGYDLTVPMKDRN